MFWKAEKAILRPRLRPGFFFFWGLEEATTKFRVDGFGVGFRGLLFRLLLALLGLFLDSFSGAHVLFFGPFSL